MPRLFQTNRVRNGCSCCCSLNVWVSSFQQIRQIGKTHREELDEQTNSVFIRTAQFTGCFENTLKWCHLMFSKSNTHKVMLHIWGTLLTIQSGCLCCYYSWPLLRCVCVFMCMHVFCSVRFRSRMLPRVQAKSSEIRERLLWEAFD